MSGPILEITGLAGGYGGADVLRGVSLSVERGSIACLLGPNGAGKTTLMMTLAGLIRPRRGAMRFDGREVAGQPPHVAVARGIVLVPQDRMVFRTLSVGDNLRVGALRQAGGRRIEADLERIYGRFPRLRERRGQMAGTLSGGEQQMLAIARALMSRPKLLLLDEPSLGLAPLVVEDIFRLVTEINAEGTSILLVDQNVPMATGIARRVHLMEQGKITFSGEPGRLPEEELVERAWFGRLAGNAATASREEVG
ncbi:ABC transporter ATP-binding protein [Arenibaculum sp.]|jgi:branched-chain amino acid transport system ATP-binding protein|uniref:ABC transporter ATP-binding protein n=1 Tax=Arenibaculum sp. TaxID=2865862 RepID=UPI002E0E6FDD|nr:ABC transporter ATP-binding protein [Arenibaculum sp.]